MSEPQQPESAPDASQSADGAKPPPLPPVTRPPVTPPPLPQMVLPDARPASHPILKTLLIIAGFIVFALGSLATGVLAWWIWSRG